MFWCMQGMTLKYFRGAGEPRKLNALKLDYNKQFVCLIFADCRDPQKHFNTKNFAQGKNWTRKLPNLWYTGKPMNIVARDKKQNRNNSVR